MAIIIVILVVGGAAVAGLSDTRPLARLVAGAAVAVGLATCASLYAGLRTNRAWALDATAWICVVLIVGGVLRAALDLAGGRVTIPLEPVAGALVLARRPAAMLRAALDARGRRLASSLTIAAVIALWAPVLAGGIAQGRVLGVAAQSIEVAVDIDCGAVVRDPGAGIPIEVHWHWLATEPLPGPTDGLVVRWVGQAGPPDDIPLDFAFDDVVTDPASGAWIGSGSPAATLLNPIEAEGPSVAYGIDVGRVGMRDGTVSFTLRSAALEGPAHGNLTVWASYAHLDWWTHESDSVSCAW